MSGLRRDRSSYDPWRDVDDAPIEVGARVVQIAVATGQGAPLSRLHQRGEVCGLMGNRVQVRFDDEAGEPAAVRPYLVRVVAPEGGR